MYTGCSAVIGTVNNHGHWSCQDEQNRSTDIKFSYFFQQTAIFLRKIYFNILKKTMKI